MNAATPTPPDIEVRGLAKTYPGGVVAVRGVDFHVDSGEVFGLLGPNGAGKSTTIGMLATTVTPTAGRATLAGFDVATQPLSARAVSSVVFQDAVVDRALTGRRNLEIHARLWGAYAPDTQRHMRSLVDSFGLTEVVDRPVSTYSGGQRRRLEIARALVSRPRVLFLDEPTVGLDPRIRYELLDIIGTLRDEHRITILLTTHYLDEAERLCDRVAVMHQGEIVALDTPAALLGALGSEILEVRVDASATAALLTMRTAGIAGDDAFTVGATVTIPLHEHTAASALATLHEIDVRTTAVSTRRPTLDDVYLRLTGSRLDVAA